MQEAPPALEPPQQQLPLPTPVFRQEAWDNWLRDMAIFGTAPAPTTATEAVFTWGRQFLPDEFVTRIEGANEQPNPDPNDPGTPNRE